MPPSPFFVCKLGTGLVIIQRKVGGDLLMGTEVMEIRPFHYLKKPPRLSSKKAHPNLSSLLVLVESGLFVAKGWQWKGPHWHSCQARLLLKFYSSVTNVFLSQIRVILMRAASGKGSPVLPSSVFVPSLVPTPALLCLWNPTWKTKTQPIN